MLTNVLTFHTQTCTLPVRPPRGFVSPPGFGFWAMQHLSQGKAQAIAGKIEYLTQTVLAPEEMGRKESSTEHLLRKWDLLATGGKENFKPPKGEEIKHSQQGIQWQQPKSLGASTTGWSITASGTGTRAEVLTNLESCPTRCSRRTRSQSPPSL